MIFTEYQALARRTQNRRLTPDEKLRHALCGLPAEVGEICGHFQKVYQGHPLIVEKVAEEMGDDVLGRYYRVTGPTFGRYVLVDEMEDPGAVDVEAALIEARSI